MRFTGLWRRGGASRQWMRQQAEDRFVGEARRQGYVARSAFKLTHLDERFGLFTRGITRAVVDLGCSPGGWCQVIRERCGDGCALVGVDLLPIKATIPNAVFVTGDFTDPAVQEQLRRKLTGQEAAREGGVDVVTSDMCPNRMGGTQDRQRIAALNQQALAFALPLLRTGGHFVCKVLGSRQSFEDVHSALGLTFLTVHVCKPPASRQSSDEAFLVGRGKLEEPRRASVNSHGRTVLLGNPDGGGGRYGLDDWPGFARVAPGAGSRASARQQRRRRGTERGQSLSSTAKGGKQSQRLE